MKKSRLIPLIILILLGCTEKKGEINPHAPGFNLSDSDEVAIALADKVMEAMGGRENWDNTRYIYWNFFGSRTLLWDKFSGDVRIEYQNSDEIILVNVNTLDGKVWKDSVEVLDPEALAKYLEKGKRIWINDSYWLVMPFKLKDSGVTLKYIGTDSTQTGETSEVIRLTFESVGVTPQNLYDIFISKKSNLVNQWSYYRNEEDTLPRFTRPWGNYFQTGNILLSEERGDRDLSDVQVLDKVPEGIFSTFTTSLRK